MGAFSPVDALPGLKSYKYASEDRSLTSKYILKPTYTRLVELLPLWLAPNMVTLLGSFFSVDSFSRASHYGLQAGEITPRWVYFAHAVELFLYQTSDALDGQQARRTGTSSPLGELFDHCVDAINTSSQAYVCASVFQLDLDQLLATEFLCTVNFFSSTWEEFHTHKSFLSVVSGPVEGILSCIALEILTGFEGGYMWFDNVFGDITKQQSLILACSAGLIFNIASAVSNVREVSEKQEFNKNLWGLAPFASMWIGYGIWLFEAHEIIAQDVFIPFFLAVAFTFASLVGRVITAHVTNQAYPMWTPLSAVPYVGAIGHRVIQACVLAESRERQGELVVSLAGVSFGVYATFIAEIITEITTYLNIGCLYIKQKSAKFD